MAPAGPAKASSATQTKGAPQENGVAVPDSEALQERIQDLESLLQVSWLLERAAWQLLGTDWTTGLMAACTVRSQAALGFSAHAVASPAN